MFFLRNGKKQIIVLFFIYEKQTINFFAFFAYPTVYLL